ncbi:hypothetical protein IWQ62_001445 [Dispira parvispora]|uniref:Uncharacterized protein n=1 Tax=Dispira parvispora TaxID=1520584 RepID=A0A9W8AXY9_9FUNG|nr:hypothetical protein IWQ62_001445 [Dispira parvispora]
MVSDEIHFARLVEDLVQAPSAFQPDVLREITQHALILFANQRKQLQDYFLPPQGRKASSKSKPTKEAAIADEKPLPFLRVTKKRRMEFETVTLQPSEHLEDITQAQTRLQELLDTSPSEWAKLLLPWALNSLHQLLREVGPQQKRLAWYINAMPVSHLFIGLLLYLLGPTPTENSTQSLILDPVASNFFSMLWNPDVYDVATQLGILEIMLYRAPTLVIWKLTLYILQLEHQLCDTTTTTTAVGLEHTLELAYQSLRTNQSGYSAELVSVIRLLLSSYQLQANNNPVDTREPLVSMVLPLLCRPFRGEPGLLFAEIRTLARSIPVKQMVSIMKAEVAHQISQTRPDEAPFPQQIYTWLSDLLVEERTTTPHIYYPLYDILQQVVYYLHHHPSRTCQGSGKPGEDISPQQSPGVYLCQAVMPVCNRLFQLLIRRCQRVMWVDDSSLNQPSPSQASVGSGYADAVDILSDFVPHLHTILQHWLQHSLCPHLDPQVGDDHLCVVSESFSYLYLDLVGLMGLVSTLPTRRIIVLFVWLVLGHCSQSRGQSTMYPLGADFTALDKTGTKHSTFLVHTHMLMHLLVTFEIRHGDPLPHTIRNFLRDILAHPRLLPLASPQFVNRLACLVYLGYWPASRSRYFPQRLMDDLYHGCVDAVDSLLTLAEYSLAYRLDSLNTSTKLDQEAWAHVNHLVPVATKIMYVLNVHLLQNRQQSWLTENEGNQVLIRLVALFVRESNLLPLYQDQIAEPRQTLFNTLRRLLFILADQDYLFTRLVETIVSLWFAPDSVTENLQKSYTRPVHQLMEQSGTNSESFTQALEKSSEPLDAEPEVASPFGETPGNTVSMPTWWGDLLVAASGKPLPQPQVDPTLVKNFRNMDSKRKSQDRSLFTSSASNRRPSTRSEGNSDGYGISSVASKSPPALENDHLLYDYWRANPDHGVGSLLAQNNALPGVAYTVTRTSLALPKKNAGARALSAKVGANAGDLDPKSTPVSELYWDCSTGRAHSRPEERSADPFLSPADRGLLELLQDCLVRSDNRTHRGESRGQILFKTLLVQFKPCFRKTPPTGTIKHRSYMFTELPLIRLLDLCKEHMATVLMLNMICVHEPRLCPDVSRIVVALLTTLIGFFYQNAAKPSGQFPKELFLLQQVVSISVQLECVHHPIDSLVVIFPKLPCGDVAKLLRRCIWPVYVQYVDHECGTLANEGGLSFEEPSAMQPDVNPISSMEDANPSNVAVATQHPLVHWDAYLEEKSKMPSWSRCTREQVLEMREIIYAVFRRNMAATYPYFALFV